MGFDAVVLAGGGGRRLGGVDKPALMVGSRSMLDTVLLACVDAVRTVVVGPERAVCRPVRWVREQPTGGGPVAALAAGLAQVTAEFVVLVAADLPFLDAGTVDRLVAEVCEDGALLVDDDGRDQLLCSAWRTSALRGALAGIQVDGARLRTVLDPLRACRVTLNCVEGRAAWMDCDTPADLAKARAAR